MTFALFSNTHYATEGGQGDLRLVGTLQECLVTDVTGHDWAEIVDLRDGTLTLQKTRHTEDVSLNSLPWDSSGNRLRDWRRVEDAMPTVWRVPLTPEESAKYEALGAEEWLRAALAAATTPPPAPVSGLLMRYLRSIAMAQLPMRADEDASKVYELRRAGLVKADVHLHEIEGLEWANIIEITEQGHAALGVQEVRGIRSGLEGAHARFSNAPDPSES